MSNAVLIIDDDTDDQQLLIEAIKELDNTISCFTAKDGFDGFWMLNSHHVPLPFLIFLDLNMPRFDGKKFLSEAKKHTELCHIPIIIYTTSSNPNDINELKTLGATEYLVKQYLFASLKVKLKRIIETHKPSSPVYYI